MRADKHDHIAQLADHVNRQLRHPQRVEQVGETLIINGRRLTNDDLGFHAESTRTPGRWHDRPTGRIRLRVSTLPPAGKLVVTEWGGPRPVMKSYAPRRDGTYPYSDIAEHLIAWNEVRMGWEKQRATKERNAGLIKRLRDELGRLPTGVVLEESGSEESPVTIRVSLDRHLTEEQTRSFVAKLRRVL